ncbi:MAG: helix-turn-helix domain-containing protein [Oscillospiraceae bacterium]|nr:helix-turn-helix domain-containing protein [Oscillospiraceae bacterium]
MRFGEKLRMELEKYEITQKEFARRVNVSASTLCGYINTNRQPDFELLKRIAAELHVTTDYLLDYEQVPDIAPLSKTERELLENFRALDEDSKIVVIKLVEKLGNEK